MTTSTQPTATTQPQVLPSLPSGPGTLLGYCCELLDPAKLKACQREETWAKVADWANLALFFGLLLFLPASCFIAAANRDYVPLPAFYIPALVVFSSYLESFAQQCKQRLAAATAKVQNLQKMRHFHQALAGKSDLALQTLFLEKTDDLAKSIPSNPRNLIPLLAYKELLLWKLKQEKEHIRVAKNILSSQIDKVKEWRETPRLYAKNPESPEVDLSPAYKDLCQYREAVLRLKVEIAFTTAALLKPDLQTPASLGHFSPLDTLQREYGKCANISYAENVFIFNDENITPFKEINLKNPSEAEITKQVCHKLSILTDDPIPVLT